MATTLSDSLLPPEVVSTGCFPYGFKRELKALFKLAWPTSLSIMFHQLLQPISLAFCGHLGDRELAAVALAISYIYMTTVSISRGLAFGGDTFFSQTYGSPNKKAMGIYLQKAIIFGFMTSLFVGALLINAENILLLARQPPDVAKLTQEYCLLFSPGTLAYCWLFTLMRYLLCQNRVIPNLVICVVSCGICSILNYGLIYQAKMGIAGSAIALCLTYYLVVFQLVGYMWATGIYRETWNGWSWECLLDWGPFAKVVLSSVFMTFIFWFYTEVGTFLAGLLSPEAISAFSIQWQIEGFLWMIPLGLGGACTARIGQYLGANAPEGAITACRVTITIQVFISVLLSALTYFPRHYIPRIFTSSPELIEYTASVIPIVALFILLEGTGGVAVGIVRGTGRQTLGAVIIFVGGYLFSLPLGIPLTFCTSMGIAGLWWGNCVGLAMEDLFLLIFVGRLNWLDEAQKAQERAGVSFDSEIDQSEAGINQSTITDQSEPSQNEAGTANDETSPLLRNRNASINNNSSSGRFSQSERYQNVNWTRILCTRALTLLFFVCLPVGSYLLQYWVKYPVHWDELCVMTNVTSADVPWNVTFPPCNSTGMLLPVDEMFIVSNMHL